MSPRTAVCFGESVIDVYPDGETVAGAPLHVAAHLAAMGWTALLLTRVGNDEYGQRIREALRRRGVDDSLVETDTRHPTGRVIIDTSGEENTFTVERPAAWDFIEAAAPLRPHEVFCFGTIAGRSETSRAALRRCLTSSGARIKALDVNLRPPDVSPTALRPALAGATVMKANEAELCEMARVLGLEGVPAAFFAEWPGLRSIYVTRGRRGAEAFDRSGAGAAIPGVSIDAVNTVGAGDAFTAGMVDALARELPPASVLEAAQEAAVSVLSRRGGLPGPQ